MKVLITPARLCAMCWQFIVIPAATRSHPIMAFGKSVPLKVLTSGSLSLSKVGDSVEEALSQSAPVMLTSYGRRECSSLTDASQKIWWRKVSRNIGVSSKLQSLPSSNESFRENMARAPMHVVI